MNTLAEAGSSGGKGSGELRRLHGEHMKLSRRGYRDEVIANRAGDYDAVAIMYSAFKSTQEYGYVLQWGGSQ